MFSKGLVLEFFDKHGCVMTTEAEAVAESNFDRDFARDVRNDIEIALGILFFNVDGGWR
jgi:hypothetical protein